MAPKSHESLKRLLITFKVELEEHLHAMSSEPVALEQASTAGQQKKLIEVIFYPLRTKICAPLEKRQFHDGLLATASPVG